MGAQGHHLGAAIFRAAAKIFAKGGGGVVGRHRGHCQDRLTHRDDVAGHQAELHRFDGRGVQRDGQLRIQGHSAIAQCLESEVERHQLGQAGRIARNIGAALGNDTAGAGVDHDRADAGGGGAKRGQAVFVEVLQVRRRLRQIMMVMMHDARQRGVGGKHARNAAGNRARAPSKLVPTSSAHFATLTKS